MVVTYKDILFANEYNQNCKDLPVPPSVMKLLRRNIPMGNGIGVARRWDNEEPALFAHKRPHVLVGKDYNGKWKATVRYTLEDDTMHLTAGDTYTIDADTDTASFYVHASLKETHALNQPISVADRFQGKQDDVNVYNLTLTMNGAVDVLDEINSQPHPITITGDTHFDSLGEACVLAALVRNHDEQQLQEVVVDVRHIDGESVEFMATRYDDKDEVRLHVTYDSATHDVSIHAASRPLLNAAPSFVDYSYTQPEYAQSPQEFITAELRVKSPRIGDHPIRNVAILEHSATFTHESLPNLWVSLDAELSECMDRVNTHGRHHGLITEDGMAYLGKLAEEPLSEPVSDDLLSDLEPEQPQSEL